MITAGERLAFLVFFLSHIPITMFIDAQAALPPACFPQVAIDLVAWYSSSAAFNDPLMRDQPEWFRHVVCCEVALQLPFFFVAVALLWRRDNRLRVPGIMYGAHVATTMAPILGHFFFTPLVTEAQRAALVAVYSPYLLVPLWLVAALARGPPFAAGSLKKGN